MPTAISVVCLIHLNKSGFIPTNVDAFYTNLRVVASVINVNDDYKTGYKKL